MTPVRNGKLAETRTLRNSSSTNQTVLATKNLKMTELLVISPYFYMFYILYAIRNTLYATRYTQYDIRITQYGSIKIERLCKTNPISAATKGTQPSY